MNNSNKLYQDIINGILCQKNILISGPPGRAKTMSALSATKELRLRPCYLPTATLDPYLDLVGVPVILGSGRKRELQMVRPKRVSDAQVLILDDINRAHPRVLNAVLELIQFRAINGEQLPDLTSIVAIMNPPEPGFHVVPLDPALEDRFFLFLTPDASPDRSWFQNRFGPSYGDALVDWYLEDLNPEQRESISFRRLEIIGQNMADGFTPRQSVRPEIKVPFHLLEKRIVDDPAILRIKDFVGNPGHFVERVPHDLNAAYRFADVLPDMTAMQLSQVRNIILALRKEFLACLANRHKSVLRRAVQAVMKFQGPAEGQTFWKKLNELLDQPLDLSL